MARCDPCHVVNMLFRLDAPCNFAPCSAIAACTSSAESSFQTRLSSTSVRFRPAHLSTNAHGAGLLEVARDRALVRGACGICKDAGHQPDARCDADRPLSKGSGGDIGSMSRTRAATRMSARARAREPRRRCGSRRYPILDGPAASPPPARPPLPPSSAGLTRSARCHLPPRRWGCAALECRGP